MRNILALGLLVGWTLAGSSVQAQQPATAAPPGYTIGEVVRDCVAPTDASSDVELMRFIRCAAYLAGLNDMLTIVMMQTRPGTYCPPSTGLSTEELFDLAVGWYASHPRERGQTARTAMLSALLSAFRCDMPTVPERTPGPDPFR